MSNECLPDDVWDYTSRDVYANCQYKKAIIGAVIGVVIAIIFIIIGVVIGYKLPWGYSLIFFGLLVCGLAAFGPTMAKKNAERDYDKMTLEYETEKARDPTFTLKDYINQKIQKQQVAAQNKMANAQTQMAYTQEMNFANQLFRR
jgi:hypothetical protein